MLRELLSNFGNRRVSTGQNATQAPKFLIGGANGIDIRQRENHGFIAEGLLGKEVDATHNPALTEKVVYGEEATGAKMCGDVGEGFLGKKKTLEAQTGIARMKHQGINKRVDNKIILDRKSVV